MSYYYGPSLVKDGLVLCLDAANPKSYVSGSNTWRDISGNNNNGTLTNGPSYNSANKGGIVFDGSNDVVLGSAISSISGNAARTVSIWAKSSATVNTPLFDIGSTGNLNQGHELYFAYQNGVGGASGPPNNSGGVYIAFWGNDIYYPVNYTSLFNGSWHYISYSYDPVTIKLSLCFDGNFGNTAYLWQNNATWATLNAQPFSLFTSLNTTNNSYYLGYARSALWNIGSYYGNSTISNLSIYNRVLSNTEILQNYNATKGRYNL